MRSTVRAVQRNLFRRRGEFLLSPSSVTVHHDQSLPCVSSSHNNNYYLNSFFSTYRYPSSFSDLDYQRDSTERLLKYPIGTFTPETWFEVEVLLPTWAKQRSVESVQMSLKLLDRVAKEKCPIVVPVDLISRVLNNWRVVWWHDGEHALQDLSPRVLFTRLVEYHKAGGLYVNEKMFYLILEASYSHGNCIETAHLAQEIFDTCIQLSQEEDDNHNDCLLPSTDLCNMVVRAWAFSTLPEASAKCEEVIARMTDLEIPLNRRTYQRLLLAYTKTNTVEGALKAEQVLRRMWSEFLQGDKGVRPTVATYSSVVSAWANSGARDAGARGEELLREMRLKAQTEFPFLQARNVWVVNAVMQCYANRGTIKATKRAREMFLELEQSGQTPNYHSYCTLLHALARVGEASAAEKVLEKLPERLLNTVIFTIVIDALAKSKEPNRIQRARSIFVRMKKLGQKNKEVLPNLYTYNAMLDCYAKSEAPDFVCSEADALLDQMVAEGIQPNLVTYGSLLHVWARFGHADRALEVFQSMPKIADETDIQCYNIVLSAFVRSEDPMAARKALTVLKFMISHGVKPDKYSYTTVISSFANSTARNRTKSAREAHRLLREMQQLYQQEDNVSMRPSGITYNAVMNAYARASRPDLAERVLHDMYHDYVNNGNTEARPTVTSYNTLIKAWLYTKDKVKASDKVQEIVDRMVSLSATFPEVSPDVISYTSLLVCHGLAGKPHLSDQVFRTMEELHASGKLAQGPTKKTFNSLRKAWSFSNEPNKEERVAEIRQEMERRFGPGLHAADSPQ